MKLKRWHLVALFAISLLSLAALNCGATEVYVEEGPTYQMRGPYGPFWICATATPPPAPPTSEPLPTVEGVPTSTPEPAVIHPTPTPYYKFGEFNIHQHVWVSVDAGNTTIGEDNDEGALRLALTEAAQTYIVPDRFCWIFGFNFYNFTDVPIEMDYSMFFLRGADDGVYGVEADVLETLYSDGVPEIEMGPNSGANANVPICHPPEVALDDPALGMLVNAIRSGAAVGSEGHTMDATAAADSAIYFSFAPDSECGFSPPDQSVILWPQIENPPPPPQTAPFSFSNYGGRIDSALPLPEGTYRFVRGFGCAQYPTGVSGAGRCPAGRPHWHTGIDLGAVTGTPVYHTGLTGGITHWSNWGDGGYGNLVVIGAEAYQFYYAHLSGFGGHSEYCPPGVGHMCKQGTLVGYVGSTGMSTGPHLHFEVRVNNVAVDPYLFFGGSQTENQTGRAKVAQMAKSQVQQALTPEPDAPVDFIVRLPDGSMVDGVTVHILAEQGREEIAQCETLTGRCQVTLPPGIYPIEFSGTLPDGQPVAPVGQKNVEAMPTWEYLYGPMAFYHTRSASTVGVVLLGETETDGQAGPYFDADPEAATPVPVVPEVNDEAGQGETPAEPVPSSSAPAVLETPEPILPEASELLDLPTSTPSQGIQIALVLTGMVTVVFLSAWVRRRRRPQQDDNPAQGGRADGASTGPLPADWDTMGLVQPPSDKES